jgi:hypothetical protein
MTTRRLARSPIKPEPALSISLHFIRYNSRNSLLTLETGETMKYLCLAYYNEKKFDTLTKAEIDAVVTQCKPYDDELHRGGHLMLVASLAPTRVSKAVRPKNGKPFVTDGPYAETKEQLGSFFIIEAKDLDEAVAEASKHPAAHLGEDMGWGIEIRPLEFFKQS